jgi:hypothetical protein
MKADPQEEPIFAIKARMISGCRQQVVDAMVFVPILLLAIALGLGILILKFWLANWQPSPLSGCFAIVLFAASPTAVYLYWQKWRLRPAAANASLALLPCGLQIVCKNMTETDQIIDWHWIERAKSRRLTARIRSLLLVIHDPDLPSRRYTVEYALCADVESAEQFAMQVAANVNKAHSR